MSVVVNDFEILPAAAPAAKAASADSGGADAAKKDKAEPCEVAAALRCLERQALRVWSH